MRRSWPGTLSWHGHLEVHNAEKGFDMFTQFDRLREQVDSFVGALAVPAVVYLMSRVVLAAAVSVHWTLAAPVMVLFAGLVTFLLIGLNETLFRKFPARVVVSLFATTVLLAASVLANLSYTIYIQQWGHYTSAIELHSGAFADFYLWYFVDMIPVVKIWETLSVKAPVVANDLTAGVPLLLFRIAVVLPILALFKRWLEVAKDKRSAASPGEDSMKSNKPLSPSSVVGAA